LPEDSLYSAPEGHPERDLIWLETAFIPQSLQFMVDMLPTIRKLIKGWHRHKILEVLDVGTGSGAGANFLATLHRSTLFGVQMKVDALDINPAYKRYADLHFKDIKYITGNIFEIDKSRTWDLVICSATVEHIPPHLLNGFINELQTRARQWVVIYTSYEEQNLLTDHAISFNKELIDKFKPESVKVSESMAWKHPIDDASKVVTFTLTGKALASTANLEEEIKITEIRKLIQNGDNEKAVTELAPLLSKLPANGALNYLMAYSLHRLNRKLDQAVTHYNLALEHSFDEFWVRYSRGSLFYVLRDYKAARIDLEKAASINPLHKGPQVMLKRLMQIRSNPAS